MPTDKTYPGKGPTVGPSPFLTRKTPTKPPRIQSGFRIDPEAHYELKRAALDQRVTVNELVLRAVREYLDRRRADRDSTR